MVYLVELNLQWVRELPNLCMVAGHVFSENLHAQRKLHEELHEEIVLHNKLIAAQSSYGAMVDFCHKWWYVCKCIGLLISFAHFQWRRQAQLSSSRLEKQVLWERQHAGSANKILLEFYLCNRSWRSIFRIKSVLSEVCRYSTYCLAFSWRWPVTSA